ncbi:MAG: HAD hydrolase family protein [Acidobacteria bacterium]|nr:HAD hydrolase family protein [Acidobacteriota bacterium]
MRKVSARNLDPMAIRLVVTDVDGIWTAGEIFLDDDGREIKRFSAYDGLAVRLARDGGIRFALLSARASQAVTLRARQLGIQPVVQGSGDKETALREILGQMAMHPGQVLYMGDDLTDLGAFRVAAIRVTVPHAPAEVRAAADLLTEHPGGGGAVRETVEWLLRAQGTWAKIVAAYSDREAMTSWPPDAGGGN